MIPGMARSRAARAWLVAVGVLALGTGAGTAPAKSYSADTFNSHVRVLAGGALEVTETVVFRFQNGTFDHVFREIPTRKTDGIHVVSASMDDRPFPRGDGINHIEVRTGSNVRVEWRFPPAADSTHTFVLTYIARGVIQQTDASDVLEWRALPSRHDYSIAAATLALELPPSMQDSAGSLPAPSIESHDIRGGVSASVPRLQDGAAGPVALATARGVRPNGWIQTRIALPRGSLVSAPPEWQQSQTAARALAPRWITAAATVALGGLVILFGLRQSYDAPQPQDVPSLLPTAPDDLAPALAGALLSNGSPGLEHAMATLVALAERGRVSVDEREPGMLGGRSFELRQTGRGALAPHEQALLETGFGDASEGSAVSFSSFGRRLTRSFRRFSGAVTGELLQEGLVDPDRRRVRQRYVAVMILLLVAGGLGIPASAVLVDRFGPWPLLVPAAVVFVGIVSGIFVAATTPLSDEGLRRAARWRAVRAYVKAVSRGDQVAAADTRPSLLPFVVAAGLASAWGKYLKGRPGALPAWFHPVSHASGDVAFVAFVTTSGATHGPGAGAGVAGGAAGGGASGAG
jgi:hypothetical protein